ncbi:MAG: transposase [Nitrospirae bacterium]|nr:transposase [Nitrospirota bacterium]
MPSIRISKEFTTGFYYLTFTVRNWYYIFDRHNRFEILAESLKYCQHHKDLKLYAYVFMLNHIHMVASSPDMIGFVRDFKKFTSKEIQKNIIATEPNVLTLFDVGNGKYEFWERTNMPKVIGKEEYLLQKISYIHLNPVRKQYVKRAEDWVWSSANPESEIIVEQLPM